MCHGLIKGMRNHLGIVRGWLVLIVPKIHKKGVDDCFHQAVDLDRDLVFEVLIKRIDSALENSIQGKSFMKGVLGWMEQHLQIVFGSKLNNLSEVIRSKRRPRQEVNQAAEQRKIKTYTSLSQKLQNSCARFRNNPKTQ